MDDWKTCTCCGEEFKVITDSLDPIAFCVFCGTELEEDEDEEEDDYWADEN